MKQFAVIMGKYFKKVKVVVKTLRVEKSFSSRCLIKEFSQKW